MMARRNHGILPATTVAKSAYVAVMPPMYTRSVVPCSAAGIVSLCKVAMRPEVAFASGDVPGITRMTSMPCAEAKGVTFVTSATWGSWFSSVFSAATSAGPPVWATRMSGPLKPGPKPSASRS